MLIKRNGQPEMTINWEFLSFTLQTNFLFQFCVNLPFDVSLMLSYSLLYPRISKKKSATVGKLIQNIDVNPS